MKTSIVVTSISPPTKAMRQLTNGALQHGNEFIVIGDVKTPGDFFLSGCRYLGIKEQMDIGFNYVQKCPTGHYARKNIGYLLAIAEGSECILETDDDNLPFPSFFVPHSMITESHVIEDCGWLNIYKYFTESLIWPRGFPLDMIHSAVPSPTPQHVKTVECPIQQGLAQNNPDVDAIFRLILPLPQCFRSNINIVLGPGSWCPFNSQNTTWYPTAYPLMYLPAHCSFRMTDIWRSFVAQRICHVNGWGVLFKSPTVSQERNEHDLMNDFKDEILGYINNSRLIKEMEKLDLKAGPKHIALNMRLCYEVFVRMGLVGEAELGLLEAWFSDYSNVLPASEASGPINR